MVMVSGPETAEKSSKIRPKFDVPADPSCLKGATSTLHVTTSVESYTGAVHHHKKNTAAESYNRTVAQKYCEFTGFCGGGGGV